MYILFVPSIVLKSQKVNNGELKHVMYYTGSSPLTRRVRKGTAEYPYQRDFHLGSLNFFPLLVLILSTLVNK